MNKIDVALGCADSNFTKESVTGVLAAEVRRLRDQVNGLTGTADRLDNENAALRTDAAAMNQSLEMMREENERLAADMSKCYRMLLSEPDIKGALFKAENILRESIAARGAK